MPGLDLQEYATSEHKLSVDQSEALLQESKSLHLSVEPVKGKKGSYDLTPGSTVGALEIGGLSMLIRPKIGIPQLLSLASYALGFYKPQDNLFDFKKAETLPDILALNLVAAARRAFGRGLLRGYLTEEDALYTVRGRIQFSEQIRRRFSIPLPVELRFDEFTEDILANRLVKAAAARLGRMTLRSAKARQGLGRIAAILENVSLLEFRRGRVPELPFDRLNEHYRQVVGLARLILLHGEFESFHGDVRSTGFLIDMNKLFQEFLTQALREKMNVSERTLRADKGIGRITLDEKGKAPIQPDLSWWEDGVCKFVGDAKYKNITGERVPNADLYQMLAYATALDLPGGLLVYAKGEAALASYKVRHTDKRLEVVEVDLSKPLETILKRVAEIGCRISELRDEACWLRLEKAA
ncbi:MAG: hypothetical protein OXO48_07725 [Caldilineaceae bacterium]|nr:hypothetical protein [Caldilineaceae bacterium]